MMRPMASTRTIRISDWERRSLRSTALRMRFSISAMASIPAKPPPTTTKVRARLRSSASVIREPASRRSRIWLRSWTASSTERRPMPCSPRPGIGNTRVTAPAVITMSWYGISNSSPPSPRTTAVRPAWSTDTTAPRTTSASLRCVCRSTFTWRPSMWPPTTSGRNG